MMEPIRLWRDEATSCDVERWRTYKVDDYQQEYAALPRADFDAREARLARAEQERDDLARLAYIDHEHRFPDATWKARCDELVPDLRAATARADALAALLKEARGYVTYGIGEGDPHGIGAAMLARIDAALEVKK
jgi:hypothetical protein